MRFSDVIKGFKTQYLKHPSVWNSQGLRLNSATLDPDKCWPKPLEVGWGPSFEKYKEWRWNNECIQAQ